MKIDYVILKIGDFVIAKFRYGTQKGKDLAIQKALEECFYQLGEDINPWPYLFNRKGDNI